MKELANASCPGETTGSFIDVNVPNNGCESYRAIAALHVSYSGSQLAYAENYVEAHPRTGLISITLGANDAGPLLLYCSSHSSNLDELAACVARGLHRPFPDAAIGNVLPEMAANLTTIYSSLIDAGFHGEFVAVTYYSTNYADVFPTNFLAAVDQILAAVTKQFGGKVADAFAAFQAASAPFGGDACAAGLLIPNPPGRARPVAAICTPREQVPNFWPRLFEQQPDKRERASLEADLHCEHPACRAADELRPGRSSSCTGEGAPVPACADQQLSSRCPETSRPRAISRPLTLVS